ncbi:hypothetical protein GMMP1_550002 [Candidatus Magnetomoraceae bacterium gMMP-1]
MINGLNPKTSYHVRAYAINSLGTSYGEDLEFATNNNDSDIVENSGFTYPTNVDYINYRVSNITDANSIEVAGFTIRDGGTTVDADNVGTTMTSISFEIPLNYNFLRRIAIYDGLTEIAESSVSVSTLTFNNISITAEDNSTKDFSIRASFNDTVSDNDQIQFAISSASTLTSGSIFADLDAGGPTTALTGDINRIEVTATKLVFVQQPTDVTLETSITPAVSVEIFDANNNIDLDFNEDLKIIASSPSLTSSPAISTASAGFAVFDSLSFSTPGENNDLIAAKMNNDWGVFSNTFDVLEPEINVKGNGNTIVDGDVGPSTSDLTDFGSIIKDGFTSITHSFTIENTNTGDLILSGSEPYYVTITGANPDDFNVIIQPGSKVIHDHESTTFEVRFKPLAIGLRNAIIIIDNNDLDESSYDFAVQGEAISFDYSDIIALSNSEAINIDYISSIESSISSTSNGLKVWSFIIRDGGADNDDTDDTKTTLTSLIIEKAAADTVSSWADTIRQAAVFDGINKVKEISVTDENLIFSSINLEVPDDGNKQLDLYLTFETDDITDNEQFQFKIQNSNVTALSNGSGFSAFSDQLSSITGDANRIEITATKLRFVQQPTTVNINTTMLPSVIVETIDIYNNRGVDRTDTLTLTSNGSILNDIPVTTAISSGLAIFNNISFAMPDINVRLIAERSGSMSCSVTSNVFDVTAPEIELQGNSNLIADGDSSPITLNNTNFGNITKDSVTEVIKTFIIKNTGNGDLNLTGSPVVSITGSDALNFEVKTQPLGPIGAGDELSFDVGFIPGKVGLHTANIIINNNDLNEETYSFEIQGTGLRSNTSDIVTANDETVDIDYAVNTDSSISFTGTINAVMVWSFTIRDGGDVNDSDDIITTLEGVTIEKSELNTVPNWKDTIRQAALYKGVEELDEITVNSESLSFSGFSVDVLDNGSTTLDIYLTFETENITDNQQFQFKINADNVIASQSGSGFAQSFTAASSISGDLNRIDVKATHLKFETQPSDVNIGDNITPGVSITAFDDNDNKDLDFSTELKITAAGANLNDSPVTIIPVDGIADFDSLSFSTPGPTTLTVQRSIENDWNLDSNGFIVLGPVMTVTGNANMITDGSSSPLLLNHSDFGDVIVNAVDTRTRIFTIENAGNGRLDLSGISPDFVIISGNNASDFEITAQPITSSVASGSSITFEVTFMPGAAGLRTAEISIGNNDTDTDPYNFTVNGTGTGSQESDIIAAGNELSDINYALKTGSSISSTSQAFRLWSFTVRDGGTSNDEDTTSTILTDLTIEKDPGGNTVSSWTNTIKQAALYDGEDELSEITVSSEAMTFTGFNLDVADGGNKTVDLYVTFEKTNINDNEQFQFRIKDNNATADSTGSYFTSFSASSDISSDKNKIKVIASGLDFEQQPSDVTTKDIMFPYVTVIAVDDNGIRDWDFTGDIDITTNKSELDGSPVTSSAIAGLATFNTLLFLQAAEDVRLFAEKHDDASWFIFSDPFEVTSPEISIKGNSQLIENGDSTPSLADHTDFDSVVNNGSTLTRIFTIENSGEGDLKLLGEPIISINGADADDFTVSVWPNNTIIKDNSTTFDITFDPPGGVGDHYAEIRIENNDAVQDPYIFAIKATLLNNNDSDIITAGSEVANIDYLPYTATGLRIWSITIRDGGASNDEDATDTILTNLTIEKGGNDTITSWAAALTSAFLYDRDLGSTIKEITVNSEYLPFTGINLTVPDDGTKTLDLYLTFDSSGIIDNEQFEFAIPYTAVTANTSGSTFTSFTNVLSSVVNDDNRLEVMASELRFVQQPIDVTVYEPGTNVWYSEANRITCTVEATDIYGKRDLDFNEKISITVLDADNLPYPVLVDSPVSVSASEGLAVHGWLRFTSPGTNVRLNTERDPAGDWDKASNFFDVQEPEIEVEGNGVVISNGQTITSTTDDTDFGVIELSSTVVNTFTIKNIPHANNGALMLGYTGWPDRAITVCDGDSSDFLISQSNQVIQPGSSRTFNITFRPIAEGYRRARICIRSNDQDENPYTFEVGGIGKNIRSDIINASNEAYDIDYTAYTGDPIDLTSNAIRVWSFKIRDGGAYTDSDNKPTILTDIIIRRYGGNYGLGSGCWASLISKAALYDGGNKVAEITVDSDAMSFTGITGIEAPDNGEKTLDLYVTFETSTSACIIDNRYLRFYIQHTDASEDEVNGSEFGEFINAYSRYDYIRNKLIVTASKLLFTREPTDVEVRWNIDPSVLVDAVDLYDNRDLDFTTNVEIEAQGTTISASAVSLTNAVEGRATFPMLSFSIPGDTTLTATRAAPDNDWDVLSTVFLVKAPIMTVTGNSISITNGSISPTTNNNTDFGDVIVDGIPTEYRTFVITNSGDAPLRLTGSTLSVMISGDPAFEITSQPTEIVAESSGGINYTTTFQICFTPARVGLLTATVTILNNDPYNDPYSFIVQGTGKRSMISDIITNGYETTDIDYAAHTGAINSTSEGIRVWSFTIRDGGITGDADILNLTLTSLTIEKGYSNTVDSWNNTIDHAALYDGETEINEISNVSGDGNILFSGLTIGVPDDLTRTLDLYLSFEKDNIVDKRQFQFKITNIKSIDNPSGSGFGAFTALSQISGENTNRIQVIATKLRFTDEPSDVNTGENISPPVTVESVDDNNNTDLDFSIPIDISASLDSLNGDPVSVTPLNGAATFHELSFLTPGDAVNLTATKHDDSGWPEVSILFDVKTPEISITGNSYTITDGSTTPAVENNTDFGYVVKNGISEVIHTFTIENTGKGDLHLSGNPIVSINGEGDFTVSTQPTDFVVSGDTTSFDISFLPISVGLREAEIIIANNDVDENPYNFKVQGTGTSDKSSDIISAGGEASNIDYASSTSESIDFTTSAIRVWSFSIRDGAVVSGDEDETGTILTSISIEKGYSNTISNWQNTIKQAALYNGEDELAEITVSDESMTFSGFSFEVPDDTEEILDLYLTFESVDIIDNEQFQFAISYTNVIASPVGSGFMHFTDAVSTVTEDANRIEITATKLLFVQQPTQVNIGVIMTPAVSVEAADANNNRDLDFISILKLTALIASLNDYPVTATAISGLATYTSLSFSTPGEDAILTAQRITNDWDADSLTFLVTAPEINLKGSGNAIANNDFSPSISDGTDFGQILKRTTDTVTNSFRINNNGNGNLDLTGSPLILISGSHPNDFTITRQPNSPVSANQYTIFDITFKPLAAGPRSAVVTIYNNDPDRNPYSFAIQGSGDSNNDSDIISAGNEPEFLDYGASTSDSITSTSDAVRVWSFTLRDGGELGDQDETPTFLTDITIIKGGVDSVTSWADTIKQAALFDGETKTAEISVSDESISFSGLTVEIADNYTKTLDLYLTFEIGIITDHDQLQFLIESENVDSSYLGSGFTSFTAVSSSADANKIQVIARKLNFNRQPSTVNTGDYIYPSVLVEVIDLNGNRDLDFTNDLKVIAYGAGMSNSPITATSLSGLAEFASLSFYTEGYPVTLTAARNASDDWDEISDVFRVTAPDTYITGNSNLIVCSSSSPLTINETDFGESIKDGSTSIIHTFSIGNQGNGDLNLTGNPKVSISGINASDFEVSIQPASPISIGSTNTFQLGFTPQAIGLRTASISLISNDPYKSPYTFTVQGTGISNKTSDIVTSNNEVLNIDYALYTSESIGLTSGVRLWSFTIRDGGNVNDNDNTPTIISSITIEKGPDNEIADWANTIKQAALYDGTTQAALITVTSETIDITSGAMIFSISPTVEVIDNGSKTLDLYLTFDSENISDNEQFQFKIKSDNALSSPLGSGFGNFTDVLSSITGDTNRIEVSTRHLSFVQQPSDVYITYNIAPLVSLEIIDENNNRDLDFTNTITISAQGANLNNYSSVTTAAGLAAFNSLSFSTIGSSVYLTATSGALNVTSTLFEVFPISPTVVTNSVSSIMTYTASGGGDIIYHGGIMITARGVCWSITSVNPTTADSHTIDLTGSGEFGSGEFTSLITGLSPCTKYFVRAYATNNVGTVYGNTLSLTTNCLPIITTNTGITLNEGANIMLTNTVLASIDPDGNDDDLVYIITQLPENGVLKNNENELNVNDVFTQSNINANKISYTHDSSETLLDVFMFRVSDSRNGVVPVDSSEAFTITVNPINDPSLLAGGGISIYTENSAAIPVSNDITVTDSDDITIEGATVSISVNYQSSEDVLSFADTGSITGTWDMASGVFSLTGTDTTENYQLALKSITYYNSSDNPNTSNRTVSFVVTDGELISNAVNQIIIIIPVNDAPVLLGADEVIAYTENSDAIAIAYDITITDIDDTHIEKARISISENYHSDQDILSFADTANITATWNAAAGMLTLTGNDTKENYKIALNSVKYQNSSDDPDISDRTINFIVNDGDADSNAITQTITIIAINDPPVLTGAGGSTAYTENSNPIIAADNITLIDPDNLNLIGAVISISENYTSSEDVLSFADSSPITGIWNEITGKLSFSGSYTRQDYQTALQSVTYYNTSDNPNTITRTISFIVNDGEFDSNAVKQNIIIIPVNDAPILTGAGGITVYTENSAALSVASDITITDFDNIYMERAVISISQNYTLNEDILSFADTANITGTWDSQAGILSLTGSDTKANYQSALRSINYENTSDDPNTLIRTVSFIINDGKAESNTISQTIIIIPINDAPVLMGASETTTYTENDTAIALADNFTITDLDDTNIESAKIIISQNYISSEDVLSFSDTVNITGTWDSQAGVLTLTGSDIKANYESALKSIKYKNTSDDPNTLTITVSFVVNDGDADSNTITQTLIIIPINDAPILIGAGETITYTENASAISVAENITITDVDDINIESSEIIISQNYISSEDVLSFSDTVNITGTWDSQAGVLTLTGSDTKANYESALRSIKYENTSDNPSTLTRTISFMISDGDADSNSITQTIIIISINDAPVLTGAGGTTAYTENNIAVPIADNIIITDVDDVNLEEAEISIIENYQFGEDVLSFTDTPNITGNWNAGIGILSLSGSDTKANYELALRSITYHNTSEDPSTLIRKVSFTVNDGDVDSNTVNQFINVIAVNDPPTISSINDQITDEDIPTGPISFTIDDVDNIYDDLIISATSSNTTLVPNDSSHIILGGTGANRTINIQPALDKYGSTTITVTVSDGVYNVNEIFNLTVNSINDAPVSVVTVLPDEPVLEENNVYDGELITLDGSGSYDVDSPIVYYEWIQTSGPEITLSDSTSLTTTFFTPNLPAYGSETFSFKLTVSDDEGVIGTTTRTVTVVDRPLASVRPEIILGESHCVILNADGSVTSSGFNDYGEGDVHSWEDIIQVSAGTYHTVGLKSDGTVVATGENTERACEVSEWTDIVQVIAGGYHTVGLKSNGTVVATGQEGYGQCDVSEWTDIAQVAAGMYYTVGVKRDGTVIGTGNNDYGQLNVESWTDVLQIAAGTYHTVGIKKDKTVIAVGQNDYGQCNVEGWTDIKQVAVASGIYHTVGLKMDETVVVAGGDGLVGEERAMLNVGSWEHIDHISVGMLHTIGVMTDGTLLIAGEVDENGDFVF